LTTLQQLMMSAKPSLEARARQWGAEFPKAKQPKVARRIQLIPVMRRDPPLNINWVINIDQSLSAKKMTKSKMMGVEEPDSPNPTGLRNPRWIR
jgi:hypothetical protein